MVMATKAELRMLGRAFEAEVSAALAKSGIPGLLQTKSALAKKLAADGLLAHRELDYGGRFPVVIRGYSLTELGRLTYCMSCADEDDGEPTPASHHDHREP
jgi:hypothetical protein